MLPVELAATWRRSLLAETALTIHITSMYRGSMVSKELIAASSRPLVLSILAEGESYGYAMIQRVKELSAGEIRWADGMLYPVLHRLEREGLIEAEWKASDTGRKRKYYQLKEEGRTALAAERTQWRSVNATLLNLWGDRICFS